MDEAPENSKESSNSARANEINEMKTLADTTNTCSWKGSIKVIKNKTPRYS